MKTLIIIVVLAVFINLSCDYKKTDYNESALVVVYTSGEPDTILNIDDFYFKKMLIDEYIVGTFNGERKFIAPSDLLLNRRVRYGYIIRLDK